MEKNINFWLNGEKYYTTRAITLFDLIEYFNYNNTLFVLEYNSLVCNQNYWEKTLLSNLDKIEIVTIVGGG